MLCTIDGDGAAKHDATGEDGAEGEDAVQRAVAETSDSATGDNESQTSRSGTVSQGRKGISKHNKRVREPPS